ncbi:MAG: hypothetical protein IT331_08145 [Anaerolineae bacterium]|nr:hypothetical protein [Anaerolineae bacterium]
MNFYKITTAVLLVFVFVQSFAPNVLPETAQAATNAIGCITVGAGLKPGGMKCSDFTLSLKFTPAGGENGTAKTVARGDHNHNGLYVNVSGDAMTGNLTTTGNVSAAGYGTIKAGVHAFCSSSGSSVIHSFNNVNGAQIMITNGGANGTCTVDFGFAPTFVLVSPYGSDAQSQRGASSDYPQGNTVKFNKFITTTGERVNGDIYVLVY